MIDFDAALRDAAAPNMMRGDFDNGDGLHPSVAGYRTMADVVPLDLLTPRAKWKARPGRAKPVPPPPPPSIALTFDDLPVHAAVPPGETQVGAVEKILAALKAAGVPEAYGFINAAKLATDPDSAPTLTAWRAAGYPLANHGWAHKRLDDISDAEFADEVARNEPALASLMGEGGWKWFRFPFLAEAAGDPERRARIRKLLGERGYKVAPVTMSFNDWAYNGPYARCAAKGDTAAIAQLEADWLAAVESSIARYREMSRTLLGRDIPYVLLMHSGAFDARMLPRTLELYRRHGFVFVGLDEATRDPFYRAEVNPALAPDPQGLEGALRAKSLAVPSAPRGLALDTLCQ